MRQLIHSTLKIALILGLLLVVSTGYIYHDIQTWVHTQKALPDSEVQFEYAKGTSLRALTQQLTQAEIIDNSLYFEIFTRFFDSSHRLQAGPYKVKSPVSPFSVLDMIKKGQIYQPSALKLTIPEGFTLKKIIARLSARGIKPRSELESLPFNKKFIKEVGVEADTLEGYLYPTTYEFFEHELKPKQIYTTMVREFFKNLPKGYEDKIKTKKLTLTEAVAFASLIELETLHEKEKTKISEVIWNRLKRGSPLGIDASLIYGIEDYDGDIKWKHLRDRNNPYNSRIHKGLPPTPIASPARSSLEAVLNPTNFGYYFYVLKPGVEREHHFSKTLKEHQKNVDILVRSEKRRR